MRLPACVICLLGWADEFEKAVMIKKPLVKLVFAMGKLPLDKIKRGDDCMVQCGSAGIQPIIPCGKMRRGGGRMSKNGLADQIIWWRRKLPKAVFVII